MNLQFTIINMNNKDTKLTLTQEISDLKKAIDLQYKRLAELEDQKKREDEVKAEIRKQKRDKDISAAREKAISAIIDYYAVIGIKIDDAEKVKEDLTKSFKTLERRLAKLSSIDITNNDDMLSYLIDLFEI